MNTEREDHLWARRCNLHVKVLSNLLYQQTRRNIMDRRDLLIKTATIVSGMSIIVKAETITSHPNLIGGIVAALGVISLVFGFSAKARDATERAALWSELNAKIEAAGDNGFNEEMLNQWGAAAATIEHGERSPNEAILLKSYEKACKYTGNDMKIIPSFFQKLPLPRQIP